MFEFHGWISLKPNDEDDPDLEALEQRLDVAEAALRREIRKAEDGMSEFELLRTGNGLRTLTAHGLRNHRYEPLFDLFRRAAAMLPDSYGLLYVRDGEDARRGEADYMNTFRAWRVAQGSFKEFADPFLSPCIPVIEKPRQ